MGSTKLRSSPFDWEATIEELTKGHELTTNLGVLMRDTSSRNDESDSAARDLIKKILGSFSRALVVLDSDAKQEKHQIDEKVENRSSGKRKIHSTQRGGQRRRLHPHSGTRITTKGIADGYAWRKYGQKSIYNAKFPRCYFRCTHKLAQDCPATKQVQQSEDDPSLFVTTYFGEHTCHEPTEAIASALRTETCIIDFASHRTFAGHQQPQFSTTKHESDEEVVSNNLNRGSLSTDYSEFRDLGTLEGSAQLREEFVGVGTEHGDVSSGLQSSTGNLGWEFSEDSFYNDIFGLEQDEYFKA